MVVELDQPGTELADRPLGEHTDEVLAAAGYSDDEIAALKESGAVAGPAAGATGSFMA